MIDYSILPDHMQEGMHLYIEKGIEPGSFLHAVLCNNLVGACEQADYINSSCLPRYAIFLFNSAPRACWGGPNSVAEWMAHKGLEGLNDAKD